MGLFFLKNQNSLHEIIYFVGNWFLICFASFVLRSNTWLWILHALYHARCHLVIIELSNYLMNFRTNTCKKSKESVPAQCSNKRHNTPQQPSVLEHSCGWVPLRIGRHLRHYRSKLLNHVVKKRQKNDFCLRVHRHDKSLTMSPLSKIFVALYISISLLVLPKIWLSLN